MKSWVRTLNLDDAHSLLTVATPGLTREEWEESALEALGDDLSDARKKELLHMVREDFLEWDEDGKIVRGLFLDLYERAPSSSQMELVHLHWALSHPLSLAAADELIAPALDGDDLTLALDAVDAFVEKHVNTSSSESRRKTRTVLLRALEDVGIMDNRGTGRHRQLSARRGTPSPHAFTYVLLREIGSDPVSINVAATESVAARITQCGIGHANLCIGWAAHAGLLRWRNNEISKGLVG